MWNHSQDGGLQADMPNTITPAEVHEHLKCGTCLLIDVREADERASGVAVMRQIQLVIGMCVASGTALGTFVSPWFLVVPALMGAGLMFAVAWRAAVDPCA